MAIDSWLLAQPRASFRLYRWSRPTLSLGYHQHRVPDHWLELAHDGRLDLVRRPSGGRAVLHGGDLTYALVWPDPPPARRRAYACASAWLLELFQRLGAPLQMGGQRVSLHNPNCFALATEADLVHADGGKRVGSAQLWRGGRLLQHGSIQLDPSPELWGALFEADPPALRPLPCAGRELEALCLEAARQALPFPFPARQPEPFTGRELAAIASQLAAEASRSRPRSARDR